MSPFDGARVVLWANEPDKLSEVESSLSNLGASVHFVRFVEQLETLLQNREADLVIAALSPSFQDPLHLLSRQWGFRKFPPMLVAVHSADLDLYLEAIQKGAYDGLGLPVNQRELVRITGRALEAFRCLPAHSVA